jgi:AraC-like DNA-binding protein
LLATIQGLIKNRLKLKEYFTADHEPGESCPWQKYSIISFVNDFLNIVEQNMVNKNLGMGKICSPLCISRLKLYRKVKALLSCSIADCILHRRLKRAKYLLAHSDKSIAEITYEIGFSNPNYFSTVFKSKYDCTPSEFRMQHPIA